MTTSETTPQERLIAVPQNATDQWLEDSIDDIRHRLRGQAAIDFTASEWVELSALLLLTATITTNVRETTGLRILLPSAAVHDLGTAAVLRFLIDSRFYEAIRAAAPNLPLALCFRPLSTHALHEHEFVTQNRRVISSSGHVRSPITTIAAATWFDPDDIVTEIGIAPGDLQHINPALFTTFGYKPDPTDRTLISPIRYVPREHLSSYLDVPASNPDQSLDELLKPFRHRLRHHPGLFEELREVVVHELLHNVADHAETHALVSLRVGDWSLMSTHKTTPRVRRRNYSFRDAFFDRGAARPVQQYLEVYVLDTGKGFAHLANIWQGLTTTPSAKQLHRFALFPRVTSRSEARAEFFVTGLGLISDIVAVHDGVLAIKDGMTLTYFTRDDLARVTQEGRADPGSRADLGATMVGVMLPLRDTQWLGAQHLEVANLSRDIHVERVGYVAWKTARNWPASRLTVVEGRADGKQTTHVQTAISGPDLGAGSIVLIDLADAETLLKHGGETLVQYVVACQRAKVAVVLVNSEPSYFKLLQSIASTSGLPLGEILCPVLAADLTVFWCGTIDAVTRLQLIPVTKGQTPAVEISRALRRYGWSGRFMPWKTIERTVAFIRGQHLSEELAARAFVDGPVLDSHGAVLNGFYEVKSFLSTSDHTRGFEADIARMLARSRPDQVIVDSAELSAIVARSITRFGLAEIPVHRLHSGRVEGPISSIGSRKMNRIAVVLSAAFSGGTIANIAKARRERALAVGQVFTIVDLTGQPASHWASILGCEYEAFACPPAPKKSIGKPRYAVTPDARLVSFPTTRSVFRPVLSAAAQAQYLRNNRNLSAGHRCEHGHHYGVFFNVRRSMATSDALGRQFRQMIRQKVADGFNFIAASEDSEVAIALDGLKFGAGARELRLLRMRRGLDGEVMLTPESRTVADELDSGSKVLVVDEGAYTYSTLIGVLDRVLEKSVVTVAVLVLEHRRAIPGQSVELARLRRHLPTSVAFECLIEINAPAFGDSDCPYCACGVPLEDRPVSPLKWAGADQLPVNDAELVLDIVGGLYVDYDTLAETITRADRYIATARRTSDAAADEVAAIVARELIIHSGAIRARNHLSALRWLLRRAALQISRDNLKKLIALTARADAQARPILLGTLLTAAGSRAVLSRDLRPAVESALRDNLNLLPSLEKVLVDAGASEEVRTTVRQLADDVRRTRIAAAVADMLQIVMIGRSGDHRPLALRLQTRDPDVAASVEALAHVLPNLPVTGETEKLRAAIEGYLRDRSTDLAELLGRQDFRQRLLRAYCIPVDVAADTLARRLGTPPPLFLRDKHAKGRLPLAVMLPDRFDAIIQHLLANSRHGTFERTIVSFTPEEAVVDLRSVTSASLGLVYAANHGPSVLMLRRFLDSIDTKVEYALTAEGTFTTRIIMRIGAWINSKSSYVTTFPTKQKR